eukprot:TRINITY_DN416_c0_g2_i10.p2 TRINITY_DN416_c0_g2~~TRINITY_DN416_c0_g2_i10.p2  ORF type:complete len:443 (-),score=149.33 TRINITY_DN416_c0_g2_i10:2283-3611(-)
MSDSALEDLSLESPKSEEYSLGSSEDSTAKSASTTEETKTEAAPTVPERHGHHSKEAEIPVLPLSVNTIEVRVLNGEKKGEGLKAYQTYTIKTKTTLSEYKKNDFSVERRFSDFIWLHDTLQQEHRGVVIPPAPEKETLLIQDRFSTDFIESRRKELERFLKHIVSHPVLNSSKTLLVFLEASEADLQTAKNPPSTGGVWGSLFGASKKIATNISTSLGGTTEVDPWFEEKTKYINSLETDLFQLSNTVVNTVRKYYELSFNHGEFGVCSTVVSQTESGDKDLAFAFERLGDVSNQIGQLQKELAHSQKDAFEDDVKDYSRQIAAVKAALAFRTEKLGEFQAAQRDYNGKKDKIQLLKDTNKPVTPAMETDLQKAEQLMHEKNQTFDTTSRSVRGEVERFLALKSKDLKAAVANLIQTNLTYELRVVDLWKKFLSTLPEETD